MFECSTITCAPMHLAMKATASTCSEAGPTFGASLLSSSMRGYRRKLLSSLMISTLLRLAGSVAGGRMGCQGERTVHRWKTDDARTDGKLPHTETPRKERKASKGSLLRRLHSLVPGLDAFFAKCLALRTASASVPSSAEHERERRHWTCLRLHSTLFRTPIPSSLKTGAATHPEHLRTQP